VIGIRVSAAAPCASMHIGARSYPAQQPAEQRKNDGGDDRDVQARNGQNVTRPCACEHLANIRRKSPIGRPSRALLSTAASDPRPAWSINRAMAERTRSTDPRKPDST